VRLFLSGACRRRDGSIMVGKGGRAAQYHHARRGRHLART
jgi:hypothetical protein